MDEYSKPKLILSGIFVGIVNGLFGGGGGMIAVPALTGLMKMPVKEAHATAILIILPVSIVSCFFYGVFGVINRNIAVPVSVGVLIGGITGAKLLAKINSEMVSNIFAAVMLVAGVKMLL